MQQMVPLSLLTPFQHNPRKTFDPEYIQELAESMKANGQWDAVLLRPLPDGTYQTVAGACRTRAANLLGWTEIRAEVQEMDDDRAEALALDTNIKRRNLSPVEEAEAIRRMIEVHKWSLRRAAETFGKSHPWIVNQLKLAAAAPEVKDQVVRRVTTPTHALAISQAPVDVQPAIARRVEQSDLSTRQTETLVRVATNPAVPEDVRKAVLQSDRVTPEHAAAVAKVPTAFEREALLKDIEAGQLTVEETARKAQAAIKRAETPRSIHGTRAARRLNVMAQVVKARDALKEIGGEDVGALDEDTLRALEGALRTLGGRLDRLMQWTAAARQGRGQRQAPGKVVRFQ